MKPKPKQLRTHVCLAYFQIGLNYERTTQSLEVWQEIAFTSIETSFVELTITILSRNYVPFVLKQIETWTDPNRYTTTTQKQPQLTTQDNDKIDLAIRDGKKGDGSKQLDDHKIRMWDAFAEYEALKVAEFNKKSGQDGSQIESTMYIIMVSFLTVVNVWISE